MWSDPRPHANELFTSSDVRYEGQHIMALSNVQTGERVEFVPTLGGTVSELLLSSDGALRSVLAGDSWNDLAHNPGYRGRLLFPFCCRIPAGKYSFEGQEYTFPINRPEENSALHGFLYNQPMSVYAVQTYPEGIQAILGFKTAPDMFPGYPFSMLFQAVYTLRAGVFELTLTAVNDGDRNAPVAFGWHPYFHASPQTAFLCTGKSYVEVDGAVIPTGRVLPTKGTRFDFSEPVSLVEIPKLDEALTVPHHGRSILTSSEGSIIIEQDPQVFKYVQLYLPPDRQSMAVEPITSPANSFNHPEFGLDVLKPGERLSGSIRIRLSDSLFV